MMDATILVALLGAVGGLLGAIWKILQSQQDFFSAQMMSQQTFMVAQQEKHSEAMTMLSGRYEIALSALQAVVKDNTTALARADAISLSTTETIKEAVHEIRTVVCPVSGKTLPVQNLD